MRKMKKSITAKNFSPFLKKNFLFFFENFKDLKVRVFLLQWKSIATRLSTNIERVVCKDEKKSNVKKIRFTTNRRRAENVVSCLRNLSAGMDQKRC